MLLRIEANRYRCLREVSQPLNPFEVLVGANASGKSTFLDVMAFLSAFVAQGLEAAVEQRTGNFHDLVWGREGASFQFCIDALIPSDKRTRPYISTTEELVSADGSSDVIRYAAAFKLDTKAEQLQVASEAAELYSSRDTTLHRPIVARSGSILQFHSENSGDSFQRDQHRSYSSLGSVPADSSFPAAAWLRELLREGTRTVALDPKALSMPRPLAALADPKRVTGSSLARSVALLKAEEPMQFRDWLSHVRTALPDICEIDSVLREEDKHRYLMVQYEGGVRVPSWMVSEGTLRLLALTILAYLPDFRGIYLVEEPENGVHPTALETIYQSLSSVYDAQVLVASHSPILLSMAKPKQILCFSRTSEGTKIVRGNDHPALQDWRGEVSLGTLAASGILG